MLTATKERSFDGEHTLFSFLCGGAAGDGIMSAGALFSRMMTRNSYYTQLYTEYPSLIRGGHNMVTIRVSDEPIYCQVGHVDILFAINLETIQIHLDKVTPGGAVLYDPRILRRTKVEDFNRPDIEWKPIPLRQLAKSIDAAKIVQNTIGVAAAIALVDLPSEEFADILRELFARKPAIAEINVKAAELGYNYVKENFPSFKVQLEDKDPGGLMVVTGNTAVASGLIAGGISVFTGYPMSPATSLLESMIKYSYKFDFIAVQCEDEIASVTMAIGANHAGGRAATATSGGGLSLMVEAIGLSGAAEIPLVVINVMRPGPSTGLPTWTGQGDLLFTISLGQDSFPRVILAPGDIQEAFDLSAEALNYAEEFQIPVLVLTDKWLGTSSFTIKELDQSKVSIRKGKTILLDEKADFEDYDRYEITEDGVSPRAIPGLPKNLIFRSTGNEHNQKGEVDDSGPTRILQMDKRMKKMETIKAAFPDPQIYGNKPEDADLTIFSWGSNKGIILDAMKRIDMKICFIHTTHVWPFPTEFISEQISKSKSTMVCEQNFDGQFNQLIRQHTLKTIDHLILRYDGRPFDPAELADQIANI